MTQKWPRYPYALICTFFISLSFGHSEGKAEDNLNDASPPTSIESLFTSFVGTMTPSEFANFALALFTNTGDSSFDDPAYTGEGDLSSTQGEYEEFFDAFADGLELADAYSEFWDAFFLTESEVAPAPSNETGTDDPIDVADPAINEYEEFFDAF